MTTTSAEHTNRRARRLQRGMVTAAGMIVIPLIAYFWWHSPSETNDEASLDITIPRLDTTGS